MGFFRRIFGLSTTVTAGDGWRIVDGSTVEVDLGHIAALANPGSAVRLEGGDLGQRLLVLHGIDGVYRAYANACACSGWRIDPVEGEEKVRCCTLAASTYDYDGKRLSGPAEKDLQTFTVKQDGDVLRIHLTG